MPEEFYPKLQVSQVSNVLLTQYDESTRLHMLLDGLLGLIQDKVVDPLRLIERALNPTVSEGILLDWIGERLGIPRPTVTSSSAKFFGFKGTESDGGRTFGQAPFYTTKRGIELVEPVGDETYRPLLLARARRLRGSANRDTIEAVLHILFEDGYINETTNPMTITVTSGDTVIWRLVSGSLFELLIPRPVGYSITISRV